MPSSATRPPSSLLYPILLLMVAMVSMQGGAALAKSLFPAVGAQGTAALRLMFSALILTAYFRPWRMSMTPAGWRLVLAFGAALGSMNLLFYMSLRTIPLGIAVALEFTGPLGVALLTSRRPTDFAWIALAAAGLLLLMPHDASLAALDPAGMAYALAAGLCWALYIVFGRQASVRHGPHTLALAATVAALIALPFGLAHAGPAMFSVHILPLAIGVAILSSSLPYALEIVVLGRMPVRMFGTLLSLEPVLAALSGLLFLGETLSAMQWAAVAAIVAASAGITASGGRQAQDGAAPRRGKPS